MNASNDPALKYAKGRPVKLSKADRVKARTSIDDKESAKVKARSGGRCEIVVEVNRKVSWRCKRRATQVHHMLGGIGVRGRGESAKAANKLHVCEACHSDLHAHVLIPSGSKFTRLK